MFKVYNDNLQAINHIESIVLRMLALHKSTVSDNENYKFFSLPNSYLFELLASKKTSSNSSSTISFADLLIVLSATEQGQHKIIQILKMLTSVDLDFNKIRISVNLRNDSDLFIPAVDSMPTLIRQMAMLSIVSFEVFCAWLSRGLLNFSHTQSELATIFTPSYYTFCTYNVCGLPQWLEKSSDSRYFHIAKLLNNGNFDFIALQEILSNHALVIREKNNLKNSLFPDKKPGVYGNSGLMTISNYPVKRYAFVPFKHKAGVEYFTRKGILASEHMLPTSKTVQIFNVHNLADPQGAGRYFLNLQTARSCRLKQFDEMMELIEQWKKPHVPQIILGDFNHDETSCEQFGILENYFGMDLVKQYAHIANGCNQIATYDPIHNSAARGKSFKAERLDYIFIRNIDKNSMCYATQIGFNQPYRQGKFASDHYSVIAKVLF